MKGDGLECLEQLYLRREEEEVISIKIRTEGTLQLQPNLTDRIREVTNLTTLTNNPLDLLATLLAVVSLRPLRGHRMGPTLLPRPTSTLLRPDTRTEEVERCLRKIDHTLTTSKDSGPNRDVTQYPRSKIRQHLPSALTRTTIIPLL